MIDVAPRLASLPESFTLRQALDADLSEGVLRRLVRHGEVTRVHRGLYRRSVPQPEQHWRQIIHDHVRRCREALTRHPGHAASHLSAAVVYGLPLMLHPQTPVHLTSITRAPKSRRQRTSADEEAPPRELVLHHCDSLDNPVTVRGGLPVMTLDRVLADVARTLPPRHSVPVLDAAVAARTVTLDDVRAVLDAQVRWAGREIAYHALTLVDPRRESHLESYSFVRLSEQGLPMPIPQVEVFDEHRAFVGRLDGLLLDSGVGLEADGMDKYSTSVEERSADDIRRSVAAELVRQNTRQMRIERLGLVVVRWTRDDAVHRIHAVRQRVQVAHRSHRIEDFTGWLRLDGQWWRPS